MLLVCGGSGLIQKGLEKGRGTEEYSVHYPPVYMAVSEEDADTVIPPLLNVINDLFVVRINDKDVAGLFDQPAVQEAIRKSRE